MAMGRARTNRTISEIAGIGGSEPLSTIQACQNHRLHQRLNRRHIEQSRHQLLEI